MSPTTLARRPHTPAQFLELLALLAQGRIVVAPTVPQVPQQEGKA